MSARPVGRIVRAMRTARTALVVLGAGALGAAMCSVTLRVSGAGGESGLPPAPTHRASAPPRALGLGEEQALRLLLRAAKAPSHTSYSGTKLLYVAGGHALLIDVWHRDGGRTVARSRDAEHSSAVSGQVGGPDTRAVRLLTEHYVLGIAGPCLRIGRQATTVVVTARDGSGVSGQFVIDDATGLMLARSLHDGSGALISEVGYLDLRIGAQAGDSAPALATTSSAEPAPLADQDLDRLRDSGWYLPGDLPGLELLEAGQVGSGATGAVQLAFSDGLFAASLFVQRGQLQDGTLDDFVADDAGGVLVHRRHGLDEQAVWVAGDHVFTLVGDLPEDRFTELILALPHGDDSDGIVNRLGRGIDRVGSWFDPTG